MINLKNWPTNNSRLKCRQLSEPVENEVSPRNTGTRVLRWFHLHTSSSAYDTVYRQFRLFFNKEKTHMIANANMRCVLQE